MEKIKTIGQLKKALESYKDDDFVVLEACDEEGDVLDLYNFYIDEIRLNYNEPDPHYEVRLCQMPYSNKGIKEIK